MKNLVLTINFGNLPTWATKAKCNQFEQWVQANKSELPFENIVLFPDTQGDTKLYWLEGDPQDLKDAKKLDEVKNKLQPILCALVKLSIEKDDPEYIKAMKELKQLRELKAAHKK